MTFRGTLCSSTALVVLAAATMAFGGDARAQSAAEAPPADAELAAEEGAEDGAAAGEDEGTGLTLQERIRAVSRRVFLKGGRFELAPGGGITTNDPFFRRWMLGARASYHINDVFSIDAGGGGVLLDEPLDPAIILGKLAEPFRDDEKLYGYADVGATFSPLYGKVALMAEWIVHFDTFVSGGLGATFDATQTPVHPAMQVGVGSRIFLTRWLVLRGDLRDYVYPITRTGETSIQNLFILNVGLGVFFPFDFEYEYEGAKARG